jgi:hypothetical protein
MQIAADIATALYYPGRDVFTGEEVYVAKGLRDRKMQRALMQFFKPENYFMVREALIQAGRQDLIGSGCDCLIPAHPPREAIESRRRRANEAAQGDHYHTVSNPSRGEPAGERGLPNKGYRPGRKGGLKRTAVADSWPPGRLFQTRTEGPEVHQDAAVACGGRCDLLFSLRENAIAKEPGLSYPERWRCVS